MKLLLLVAMISIVGCSNPSDPVLCSNYSSQSGDTFSICRESHTYSWNNRSGRFETIIDSVNYFPVDSLYILDKNDTIIVKYPSVVDQEYNWIYISKDGLTWTTYKELP